MAADACAEPRFRQFAPVADPDAKLEPSGAMLVMAMPGGPLPTVVAVLPSGLITVCWPGPAAGEIT